MNLNNSNLQDGLLRYYSAQLKRYETLEAEVQLLQQSDDQASDTLGNVRRILQEISECDKENTSIRNAWTTANETASPKLKETVKRVTERIERVIGQIATSETHALESKEQLRPLISDEAARRKVVAAYGAH